MLLIRKCIFIILILTHFYFISKAQETFSDTKYILTLNVISPFDMFTPRWRVGYTQFITNKWALSADIGFCNYETALQKGRISDKYLFWDIRPEIKYVFRKHRTFSPYIATELFYMYHTEKIDNYYYIPENSNSDVHFDQADYFRQKYGIDFKGGFYAHFFGHIGVETYFGIGYKINDTRYSNVKNNYIMEFGSEDEFADYRVNEGLIKGLNITLGAKLYLAFKPSF